MVPYRLIAEGRLVGDRLAMGAPLVTRACQAHRCGLPPAILRDGQGKPYVRRWRKA